MSKNGGSTGRYGKKYPKMVALLLTLVIAYIIFYDRHNSTLISSLKNIGDYGVFISGLLFSYGFTAAPATAIFLSLGEQSNIIITAMIGGLGALIADLTIFELIRTTMADELHRIEREQIFKKVKKFVPRTIRHYIIPVIGGLIIASPLPDELGVALIAGTKNIKPIVFSIISYVLNTIGIYILLNIGSSL
ncbi:hypothetical protein HY483_03430 [Candidatus Woesearchaeota archaeon]|nr:hypothetical protein [Candidatus Woesearchaeota archaeon]